MTSPDVDLELPSIEPAQLAIGVGIAVAAVVLARALRWVLRRYWRRRGRTVSYARVFSLLVAVLVAAIGIGIGLTVAFPRVQPIDILGGLGIASIAAGIAFQNVLSNLFAGILLLMREPFRAGDQIAVAEIAGTVQEINLRETVVRTFDGRLVLVPNSTVYSEVLTVQTGYAHIRTTVVVGVDYATDLPAARRTALDAVRELPGVADNPAPECLLAELTASTINFEVRFWSGARQLEALETRDRVIEAVVNAYSGAGIEMPADIRVLQPGQGFTEALQHSRERAASSEGTASSEETASSPRKG